MSMERELTIGDREYQEKVIHAIIQDHSFAEQMADVIVPEFFDQKHLEAIVDGIYAYRTKYGGWPSPHVIELSLKDRCEDIVLHKAHEVLQRANVPLNGDMSFVQETSLEFCRKQSMVSAIKKAIDMVEGENYESIVKVISDAMSRGATKDIGREYIEGFDQRAAAGKRDPLPTPWEPLNKVFGGGWERKTLVTFIAPTGAGKTHFLCNVSAGAVACGLNAAYVSLEIAQYKVELRHDSYFSGVRINDVPSELDRVKTEVTQAAKGRLFVKEFPTKKASVQTIRSYLERLRSARDFKPDVLVIDYADLLRPTRSYGEKRHELESTYEELRGLAHEFDCVVVTADQTNRTGLDQEVVTLSSIAECYNKATVCDLIMTISRRAEDKTTNSGRLWIAKSRLGADGMVFPFVMNGATVKATILDKVETIDQALAISKEDEIERSRARLREIASRAPKQPQS